MKNRITEGLLWFDRRPPAESIPAACRRFRVKFDGQPPVTVYVNPAQYGPGLANGIDVEARVNVLQWHYWVV